MAENYEPTEQSLSGESIPSGMSVRLGSDGMTYPIGFIQIAFNHTNGNAVGGMLVTDNTGIPLEFMITSAVRPTRPQRILYGERLKSYVAVDLCAKELITHIKTAPKVIFVRDAYLLDAVKLTSIPLLMLQRVEALGANAPKPTVVAPPGKSAYEKVVDLSSLHTDMVDAFDRIEKCREVLAEAKEEYRI